MCLLCEPDSGSGDDLARRAHVLQLLALIEHPGALPTDAALRLSREIMTLIRPKSGAFRCDRVTSPEEPIGQTD